MPRARSDLFGMIARAGESAAIVVKIVGFAPIVDPPIDLAV
jgi:hypothetical protein